MFKGVYPPIPTPFVNEQLALDRLRENVRRWSETGLSGFVVAGSNGESPYLSDDEKLQVVRSVRETAPHLKVIAGTGCETTQATIDLTRACADAGADAALVLPSHYFTGNMTSDVLSLHFEQIADAVAIPVLLYNMPKNTGVNLGANLVASLSQHPNIVGIKDSSGDIVQISETIANTQDDFEVFAGSGSFLLPALAMGAAGGMMAVANVAPASCVHIVRLAEEGDLRAARHLQQALLPLNAAVTSRFGVPGLKAALDIMGYFGGDPRRPLKPLPQADRLKVEEILDAYRAVEGAAVESDEKEAR